MEGLSVAGDNKTGVGIDVEDWRTFKNPIRSKPSRTRACGAKISQCSELGEEGDDLKGACLATMTSLGGMKCV